MTMAGTLRYNGPIEKLQDLLMKGHYNQSGFLGQSGFDGPLFLQYDIHPVFVIGTKRVTTVQDLIDLIDLTQPTPIAQVIFEVLCKHGGLYKYTNISYHRWYKMHGLVRAINGPRIQYAYEDTIPESWLYSVFGIRYPP